MLDLSRRDLLACFVAGSALCAGCCSALAAGGLQAEGAGSYYALHEEALKAAFHQMVEGAQQVWRAEFGAVRSRAMAEQAAETFDKLFDQFPEVGGDRNWDTQFIPVAAWYVALYRPMQSAGKSAEDVGKLVYDLYRRSLEGTPKDETTREGENLFNPDSMAAMAAWAEWTQKREYPANWVAAFIRGDGKEFDYGYDYTECGLVKYFRSQGVSELAPYVCLNDFLKSAAIGSGLSRTRTLAEGDEVCDFRYKKGRPVIQDWDTEIDRIQARSRG